MNMKISYRQLSVILFAGLSAIMLPLNADAQLLKKISKGLEKVNKTLDKVEQGLKPKNNDKKKPTTGNGTPQTIPQQVDDSRWQKAKPVTAHPYITSETKFLKIDNVYGDVLSNVHSGIFAVKRGNCFEFWRTDGKKVFNAEWEMPGFVDNNKFPEFNGGVAVARKSTPNAAGKKLICLLYANGAVKELDPAYEAMSQFVDGLALAKVNLGNYKTKYVFVNTRGEKVFTHLDLDKNYTVWAWPLRDGLRAFKQDGNDLMGFIDANGVVKIQPKYKDVRSFSEGYAWVAEDTRVGATVTSSRTLIDTKGNVVFKAPAAMENRSLTHSYFGDVHDGIFYMVYDNLVNYYNLKGEKLASFEEGSCFYDGYAFVQPSSSVFNISPTLVNTRFEKLGIISDEVMTTSEMQKGGPVFEPYGLATVMVGENVIDPKGNLIIDHYADYKRNVYIEQFGQFDAEGYATVKRILIGGKDYIGLMRPTGHIDWLFSANGNANFTGEPVPEDPIRRPIIDDPIPEPQPIDPEEPAIGPTVVTQQTYKVTVVADPPEGGSVNVSPAGPFNYGEYARFTASAAEGWEISTITDDAENIATPTPGQSFAVTSDITITVKFHKKPEIDKPVDTGVLEYSMTHMMNNEFPLHVTYYAEISENPDIATPYGSNTYGFLVPMMNPMERVIGKGVSADFLFLPLQITGYQKENDKEYLVLSGGSFMAHDVKVQTEDVLANLWFNLIMGINGYNNPKLDAQLYRVEVTGRGDDGEMTLGGLEVFNPNAGKWVPGGDKSVKETSRGFMASTTSYSLPAELFDGVTLKPAKKRNDIYWYPPQEWYEKSSLLDIIKESLDNQYKNR